MLAVYIICIYLLLKLFLEDWRTRAVHWYLFPSILVCTLLINASTMEDYGYTIIANVSIVAIQIASILLYLKLRRYDWRLLTANYLALGDILFLLVLSFSLETEAFLIFNICSIVISLLVGLVWKLKTIPFAGIQSLMLALLWVFNLTIL